MEILQTEIQVKNYEEDLERVWGLLTNYDMTRKDLSDRVNEVF
jgi:hypothetical protein